MLSFSNAYMLTGIGDVEVSPRIVVGVRRVVGYRGKKNVVRYEYVPNHPFVEYMSFVGTGERVQDGTVEVDDVETASKGKRLTWVFQPLTLEVMLANAHMITGGVEWLERFESDAELNSFYVEEYLHDNWLPTTGNTVDEAVAFPIGTIRAWQDGYDHQKMPNGEWVRIGKTNDAHRKFAEIPADDDEDDLRYEDHIPHGEWKEVAEGLPRSTVGEYFEVDPDVNPEWPDWMRIRPKAERQSLHERIEKVLRRRLMGNVKPPPPDKAPIAVLTMGVPASGKSHAVQRTILEEGNFVHIDPDEVKKLIPEYQQAIAQKAKNAAAIVHDESTYVADALRDEAVSRGLNFVFEGVGRDVEYYSDMIDFFKLNGYRVQVVFANVEDPDLAVERAAVRGEKTGRWVPEKPLRSAAETVPKNFMKLMDKVDDFAVFDCNGDGKVENFSLKLAWARQGNEEYVVDHDMRDRLQKAVEENFKGSPMAVPKTNRPPAVPHMRVIELLLKAGNSVQQELDSMSKTYKPGEGVTEPATDGVTHRWKNAARGTR